MMKNIMRYPHDYSSVLCPMCQRILTKHNNRNGNVGYCSYCNTIISASKKSNQNFVQN